MLYQRASFTVPASSSTRNPDCSHGWKDPRGKCVLCGVQVALFAGAACIEGGGYEPVMPDRFVGTETHMTGSFCMNRADLGKTPIPPMSVRTIGPQNASQEPD
jgi:hypothetical protein